MYYLLGLMSVFLIATFFVIKPLKVKLITKVIASVSLGIVSVIAYLSMGTGMTYWYSNHHPQLIQFYYALENPALPLRDYKPLADQAARELGNTSLDVPGWLLLSQFYLAINELSSAEYGLEKAYQGNPEDQHVATQYAQVSFSANKGVFKPEIKALLPELVEKDHDNTQANLLLAMLHSQQGEYQKAVDLWKKLQVQMSPNSMEAKLIQRGIEKAEQKLKQAS
jgi:cytochrome c-type biogenesis protein CcmH/NrfG